jgi:hypothetical protein
MGAKRSVDTQMTQQAVQAILGLLGEYDTPAALARALEVNQGYISRALADEPYCAPALYRALVQKGKVEELPTMEYRPCPQCGEFHAMRSCTRRRKRGARQRFLVPVNDLDAAMAAIENEYGVRLVNLGSVED